MLIPQNEIPVKISTLVTPTLEVDEFFKTKMLPLTVWTLNFNFQEETQMVFIVTSYKYPFIIYLEI